MRKPALDLAPSDALQAFVKEREGCVLRAYRDQGGTWTIGYGHATHVMPNDTITQAMADRLFAGDINSAALAVQQLVTVPITQGQFDCLTDFTYEMGRERFARSDVLTLVNKADFANVPGALRNWCHVAGKFDDGVYKRRQLEIRNFWDQAD